MGDAQDYDFVAGPERCSGPWHALRLDVRSPQCPFCGARGTVPPEDRAERFGLVIRRSDWLEDTCAVQRNAYELEPEGVAYIKEQVTAAGVELHELLQSLPWKFDRDGTPRREPTEGEIEAAKGELVDALIFTGNLAVALGFTDDELWEAVNSKAVRNVSKRRGLGKDYWLENAQ